MSKFANQIGAVYRRYSDDILLICHPNDQLACIQQLNKERRKVRLKLSKGKTNITCFTIDDNGILTASKPVQYLGFTFDGQRILIRPRTISKFIGRMSRAVRSVKRAASKACREGGDPRPFSRKLYRKYSHLGKKNNYPHYMKRASTVMDSSKIIQQHRKHWNALNKRLSTPVCKKPCPELLSGLLPICTNLLAHGEIVGREVYCRRLDKGEKHK